MNHCSNASLGWRIGAIALVLAMALFGGVASAHQSEPGTSAKSEAPIAPVGATGTRDAKSYFTDTELVTQDGKRVRFYSDVLQNRVVLINVVYTSCEDACPMITRKLIEVRSRLAEPAGKEVWFVSISTDPERDSPQALKKFAKNLGVDERHWVFLTGERANIDQVLKRLGQLSASAEDHSTLLIAGNVAAKRWSKIRPDAPVAAIAERLKVLTGTP